MLPRRNVLTQEVAVGVFLFYINVTGSSGKNNHFIETWETIKQIAGKLPTINLSRIALVSVVRDVFKYESNPILKYQIDWDFVTTIAISEWLFYRPQTAVTKWIIVSFQRAYWK